MAARTRENGMEILVYAGAALALLGLAGLVWCIVGVMRDRRAGLEDDELRARLQKAVALNLGALLVSAMGLMMVIVGVVLG
jgi:hypothetical protein